MGKVHAGTFLTFDDVLIRPARSSVEPREANVETLVAKGFSLKMSFIFGVLFILGFYQLRYSL